MWLAIDINTDLRLPLFRQNPLMRKYLAGMTSIKKTHAFHKDGLKQLSIWKGKEGRDSDVAACLTCKVRGQMPGGMREYVAEFLKH